MRDFNIARPATATLFAVALLFGLGLSTAYSHCGSCGVGDAAKEACPADCAKPCCASSDATSKPAKDHACGDDCAEACCASGDAASKPAACAADCTKPCCAADSAAKAAIGKPAPNFTLADASGKEYSLADYRGKNVVLIWTNPACPFIQPHNEAGTVNKLAKEHGDKAVFLQIDSTNPEAGGSAERTKATAAKYKIAVPTLHDFDGEVGRAFGAKTTPHTYVIDKEGVLVYHGALDNDAGGKLGADERVNYVEAALGSVVAGKAVENPTVKPYGCGVKYAKPDSKKKADQSS